MWLTLRRIFTGLLCALILTGSVRADAGAQYVALTFDDGPSGRFTRRLLDGLQARNAKATFLLCGYRMLDYGAEGSRIAAEGHEIGLHGYSHDPMCDMTEAQVAAEIRKTAALLPGSTKFLRPPGGKYNEATIAAARNAGLAILSWSLDPKDWATDDAAAIVSRVVEKARDGDVILLHDMSDSSVTAALRIVDQLQARGFRFVTVSQLAKIKGVDLKPGQVYHNFP